MLQSYNRLGEVERTILDYIHDHLVSNNICSIKCGYGLALVVEVLVVIDDKIASFELLRPFNGYPILGDKLGLYELADPNFIYDIIKDVHTRKINTRYC